MKPGAFTARQHFFFWLAAFAVFCALVWLLEGVLLPFILGLGIAYLLNPLVETLEKKSFSRPLISLGLVVVFFGFLAAFLAVFIPLVINQIAHLAKDIPELVASLRNMAAPYAEWIGRELELGKTEDAGTLLQENIGSVLEVARHLMGGVAAGGQVLAGLLSVLFLMPIVSYFMLKEWPAIRDWVRDVLPRKHERTIRELLFQIDRKIAGFLRGQLAVVLVIAVMYSAALSIAGLNYAILIGIVAGVISIIPYVGSFTGLAASVIVAWFQSGQWSYVLLVAGIFLVGQALEGNLITPRLVGKYVGLHPLWVLFVLLAGGALFGLVGMMLAVPVAASAGVLAGFAIQLYKDSSLYKGDVREQQ